MSSGHNSCEPQAYVLHDEVCAVLLFTFSDLLCGEREDDYRQRGLNVRRRGLVYPDLHHPCYVFCRDEQGADFGEIRLEAPLNYRHLRSNCVISVVPRSVDRIVLNFDHLGYFPWYNIFTSTVPMSFERSLSTVIPFEHSRKIDSHKWHELFGRESRDTCDTNNVAILQSI